MYETTLWGNGKDLCITISKQAEKDLDLHEGDTVIIEMLPAGRGMTIEKAPKDIDDISAVDKS
jgi:hypothetical protein